MSLRLSIIERERIQPAPTRSSVIGGSVYVSSPRHLHDSYLGVLTLSGSKSQLSYLRSHQHSITAG
jgi:hypothetical protein